MKLATFDSGQGARLGAVIDGDHSLVDLSSAFQRRHGRREAALDSMPALIDAGDAGRAVVDSVVADPPEEDVAYAELDGAPPGAPIDLRAAITDMVTYNGGPLRCLA